MTNLENQKVNKDDETVSPTQNRLQESHTATVRPDLNEIKKRNAKEEKKDRKSLYSVAGVMVVLIVVVIVLVYFFS